jgi:hypothetical protein
VPEPERVPLTSELRSGFAKPGGALRTVWLSPSWSQRVRLMTFHPYPSPVDGKVPPTIYTAAGTDITSIPLVPDLWQSRQISVSRPFARVIRVATYLAPKHCWGNYIEVIQIALRRFGSSSVISFRIRPRERSAEDQHHRSVCSAAVVTE